MLKQLLAALLRLSILSVVFLGSCVGSGLLYMESPKWNLEQVDLEKDKTFFGAYREEATDEIEVELYRFLPQTSESEQVLYRLPRETLSYQWTGGGSASITAENQADGSQLVRIHVVGDTPWTSLSEYRVVDNEILPLRHGHSNSWFLLGVLLSPVITWLAIKPVRRLIGTVVRVDEENSEAKS